MCTLPCRLITTKIIAPLDAEKTGKLDYKQRQDAAIQKDLKSINDLLNTARSMKGLGFGDCWPAPLKDTEAGLVSTGGEYKTHTHIHTYTHIYI